MHAKPGSAHRTAPLKVGELARRSGVSVRTLHYYEQIGLLAPSAHTPTGHRLYALEDVTRLQQIVSLRQLGLSLTEIRECLTLRSFDPLTVVEIHLTRVREQIELQRRVCDRLERVARALRSSGSAPLDDFIQAIEVTRMLDKYPPEQRALFEERARIIGQERLREIEAAWPTLISEIRAEMAAGADPASERVQALMTRWRALGREFSGDNQAVISLMRDVASGLPARDPAGGMDQEVIAYAVRAQQAT
jgi:DNA-binding transcriptional MerR regulator